MTPRITARRAGPGLNDAIRNVITFEAPGSRGWSTLQKKDTK